MGLFYFILGAVLGVVGGYITALYWGKPAKELKKLQDRIKATATKDEP